MDVLTGPQRTPEERGHLAETAGLLDITPALSPDIPWWAVNVLYRLAGWDRCPAALADVAVATAMGIVMKDLL
ncbi:hypothetical protein ACFY1A_17170 [Streptomyces sp. NPDC001520]|uniref:hypothetical protein n=1 Tax=Streptomyces sp. NPDC001520 TaxID=3364581 RepID=UPI0036C2350F